MSDCQLIVLPSRRALSKVEVCIADYFALYQGAQVTVYSPLKEILNAVPSQEQCKREMGERYPSMVTSRFVPELFRPKGVQDLVGQLEDDHPHRGRRFFVSALNDRYTQKVQKAASIFDQKKFLWVWHGEATQVVLIRIVLHMSPLRQHIIVGIPSPGLPPL